MIPLVKHCFSHYDVTVVTECCHRKTGRVNILILAKIETSHLGWKKKQISGDDFLKSWTPFPAHLPLYTTWGCSSCTIELLFPMQAWVRQVYLISNFHFTVLSHMLYIQ